MIKVNGLGEMPESIGGVPAEERETVIRKDFLDKKAHVCTTDHVEYRRLMRKCRENPGVWRALGYDRCCGQPQTGYFEAPAKLVGYSAPRPAMSAEMKAEAAARLKAGRDAKAKAGEAPEKDGD